MLKTNKLSLQNFYYLSFFILLSSYSIATLQAQSSDLIANSLKQLLATKSCPRCDLRGVNLAHLDLSGANLQSADLTGADLTRTNLRGANLSRATLLKTRLIETKLSAANLRNADLSDLDIDEAFEWMEIIGTQLEGAKFKYGIVCGSMPTKGGWGCQHL